MSKIGFVYALKHPKTGEVRYIGSTTRPNQRLTEHIRKGTGSTSKWVEELRKDGLEPDMEILETCDFDKMTGVETEEILKHQKEFDLLNNIHTGRGVEGSAKDLTGDTIHYQFEVFKDEWENWKDTLDRGTSIQSHLRRLIRRDTRQSKTKDN